MMDQDPGMGDANLPAPGGDAPEIPSTTTTPVITAPPTTPFEYPTEPPLFLSPVPLYGTILISTAGCLLLLCCICWWCAYICRDRGKKRKGPLVSTPSVGMKQELIQPGMDDLDGFGPDYLGQLHFSLEYNTEKGELAVAVLQARDLPAMDVGGTSDPYVKVCLLPATKPKFQTRVLPKTCSPVFQETFMFPVTLFDLCERTVAFYVYDHDKFSKDDLIGQVLYPLREFDYSHPIQEWIPFEPGQAIPEEKRGEVCFTLRYVPATGQLTIVIVEAKNLHQYDKGRLPDTFVKATLFIDNKRIKSRKTPIKTASINPYFNECFVFEVPFEKIMNANLRVSIVSPARFVGPARRIGLIELGANTSAGSPLRHWSDMLSNPRHAVACWHELTSGAQAIPE